MSLSYGDGKVLLEDIRAVVRSVIREEMESLMSQLSDELAGYKADVERQFQQIRDQFAPIIQGLQDDKVAAEQRAADAVASLETLQADVDTNIQSIQSERTELQSDDAPPEEPPAG